MICLQVIANDTAVGVAGSQGNFELNVMRPIIIKNVLHSSQILGDACDTLHMHSIDGIALGNKRIEKYVSKSLMLVSAFTSVIGYDTASSIAHKAFQENLSLREAAVSTGYISPGDFDRIVIPAKLVGDPDKDLSNVIRILPLY